MVASSVNQEQSKTSLKAAPQLRRGRYSKIHYVPFDSERSEPEQRKRGDERSDFEIDRSRIVHAASFRRLQGKIQVFAIGEGDFFRTRLTHSLETAQIGKGLALRLGADPDLVETVCLAHDVGHPPFGHAGETELNLLMAPYGGFEANAQNLRLLSELEQKSTRYKVRSAHLHCTGWRCIKVANGSSLINCLRPRASETSNLHAAESA